MKKNRSLEPVIIILIIIIATFLGIITFKTIKKAKQVGNSTTEVYEENIVNEMSNNKIDNEKENVKNETPEPEYNDIIEEPIIGETNETIASKYYYNQLSKEGKIFYDGLEKNKENLTLGNYKINYGTIFNTLLHTPEGEEKLNIDFQSAWNAFSYDNMDLYYIDVSKMRRITTKNTVGGIATYEVTIEPDENSNYYQQGFTSKGDVKKAQEYLDFITDQIIEQVKNDNEYNKIRKVHNWLISVVEYNDDENNKNRFNIYGTIKNKKAVCEGYARSFKYIMDKIGVPCVLVSGKASSKNNKSEEHAWNYVKIVDKWYAIDTTWDDPIITGNGVITNEIKYKYFLKGSKDFFIDHKEENEISKNSIKFKFPTLSIENYKN